MSIVSRSFPTKRGALIADEIKANRQHASMGNPALLSQLEARMPADAIEPGLILVRRTSQERRAIAALLHTLDAP